MNEILNIGSRASALALWQANYIKTKIEEKNPNLQVNIVKIKTTGDKILDVPLAKVGGKGLFVKEIEEALIAGKIDLAVHSMKDVPTALPESLEIAAITKREDPRDALISKQGFTLKTLPLNAKIGTSSLRRQSQLLFHRPDFNIYPLRGNIDTRIKKAFTEDYDAIILAAAGIKRMGWQEKITEYINKKLSMPAIGQGALGLEIRKEDKNIRPIIEQFIDQETSFAVKAERAFLKRLEGGCQVPISAHGQIVEEKILIKGFVASTDGKKMLIESDSDTLQNNEQLGIRLAETLIKRGANKILEEVMQIEH